MSQLLDLVVFTEHFRHGQEHVGTLGADSCQRGVELDSLEDADLGLVDDDLGAAVPLWVAEIGLAGDAWAGVLQVEDLSAKWQNGLEVSIATLFGRTAGRITLNNVQFAL